jgi:magnesium transporter
LKFNLNKYILEDIESKDQPSDFIETKDYSVLVLRLPYIKDEEVNVVSDAFLIKDKKVYKYDRKKEDFEEFSFDKLHQFLDVRVDKILVKLSKLHTEIAKIEDDLYDDDYSSMEKYLLLKKDLGIIERVMSHTELAFERFLRKFKENIDEFAFNDLKEHISRVIRFSKTADEKLDYLHSFYRGEVDRKMNNVMFILTILSAIFMPLTLVTGFFGMNTGGLPFVDDSDGTLKVVVITAIFEIPFIYLIYRLTKFDKRG